MAPVDESATDLSCCGDVPSSQVWEILTNPRRRPLSDPSGSSVVYPLRNIEWPATVAARWPVEEQPLSRICHFLYYFVTVRYC